MTQYTFHRSCVLTGPRIARAQWNLCAWYLERQIKKALKGKVQATDNVPGRMEYAVTDYVYPSRLGTLSPLIMFDTWRFRSHVIGAVTEAVQDAIPAGRGALVSIDPTYGDFLSRGDLLSFNLEITVKPLPLERTDGDYAWH